jgi:hypothetical protein
MAGFVTDNMNGELSFHFGKGVSTQILDHCRRKRVITLQLDGDELEAALWGLNNYRKGSEDV